MSNVNNIVPIDFNGTVCLNKNKVEVEQFRDFNKKNSAIYGDCLSPFFQKEENYHNYWDKYGNYYDVVYDEVNDKQELRKNGKAIMEADCYHLVREKVEEKCLAYTERGESNLYLKEELDNYNLYKDGVVIDTFSHNPQDNDYVDIQHAKLGYVDDDNFYVTFIHIVHRNTVSHSTDTTYIYFKWYTKNGDTYTTRVYQEDEDYQGGDLPSFDRIFAYVLNPQGYLFVSYFIAGKLKDKIECRNLCFIDGDKYEVKGPFDDTSFPDSRRFMLITERGEILRTFYSIRHSDTRYMYHGIGGVMIGPGEVVITGIQEESFSGAFVGENPRIFIDKGAFCYYIPVGQVMTEPETEISFADMSTTVYNVVADSEGFGNINCIASFSNGYFSILYNNGLCSGIASKQKLIDGWFNIDTNFEISDISGNDISDCALIYKNIDGNIYKVRYEYNQTSPIKIIENRYIVWNIIESANCYDVELGKVFTYAPDWNDRYISIVRGTKIVGKTYKPLSIIIGSGINVNYETSESSICSLISGARIFNALIYEYPEFRFFQMTNDSFGVSDKYDGEGVDKYIGIDTTVATYYGKDPNKEGLVYPIAEGGNVLLSPSLYSEFVPTYTNNDLIKDGKTSYNLMYKNGVTPILLYQLLTGVEGLDNVFSIQGQFYGIANKKIIGMTFLNGVVSSISTICDISGLKYLGTTPTQAFLFSPLNRTIYSFTGDAVLREYTQANDISEITGVWFNTGTQSIIVACNVGLVVISDDQMFIVDDWRDIENLYLLADMMIITLLDGTSYRISYNELEDYDPKPVQLETKFYGIGNNQLLNADCWYIRVIKNEFTDTGTIKVKCLAYTDIGVESEEREIQLTSASWDSLTGSFYFKYQPSVQAGVGVALSIESPFPIVSVHCGYTDMGGTPQLSRHNI